MYSASGGDNSNRNFIPSREAYASSIGTNNMCGFASFVATVNAAILNPNKFYPAGMPEHTQHFMRLYMDNLNCNDQHKFRDFLSRFVGQERELQTICAIALKTAFTESMAQEFEMQTSFETALNVLLITIINDNKTQLSALSDYSKLIVPAIKSSDPNNVLGNAYSVYLDYIVTNNNADKAEDTAAFMKFIFGSDGYEMSVAVQDVLREAKQKYAQSILMSSYMATEIDLICLARLVGLKGIAIKNIRSSSAPTFTSIFPENLYTIELMNYGIHWEAKSLPRDLIPILNQKTNGEKPKKPSVSGYTWEKTKDIDKVSSRGAELSEYVYTRDKMIENIKNNLFFLNDDEINKNLFPGFISAIISDLRSLSINLIADAVQEDIKKFLEMLTVQLDNLEKGNLTPEPIKIPLEITSNKHIDEHVKKDLRLIIDVIVEAHGKYLDLTRECNERLDKENNNKNNKNKGWGCNIM